MITILRPGKYDEIEAVKVFEKYADQSVGYTDCISFVLMRSHKIKSFFTFDNHFQMAGFSNIPWKPPIMEKDLSWKTTRRKMNG